MVVRFVEQRQRDIGQVDELDVEQMARPGHLVHPAGNCLPDPTSLVLATRIWRIGLVMVEILPRHRREEAERGRLQPPRAASPDAE